MRRAMQPAKMSPKLPVGTLTSICSLPVAADTRAQA